MQECFAEVDLVGNIRKNSEVNLVKLQCDKPTVLLSKIGLADLVILAG